MKIIKKIFFWFVVAVVIVNLFVILSGNSYLYKTFYYQHAGIDDYKIFENRSIPTDSIIPLPVSKQYNTQKLPVEFRNYLIENKTVAFLVLKNDTIIYEEYWDGYHKDAISNSFSVAKSIVSILVGIAIDEGKIKSVHQKVSDFIPEYAAGLNAELTIEHLLNMSAAFNWDEKYNSAFTKTAKAYYGKNLEEMVLNLRVTEKPGIRFIYQSSNQLVLAYILKKVYNKTLSEFASEKLWKPLGAEHEALWSVDKKNGLEKAYCCFNATARDFSRIGLLYLHNGTFHNKRIISEEYVKKSLEPANLIDEEGKKTDYYGYSWWISNIGSKKVFYARGILGQYIFIIPEKNIVAVRLGKQRSDVNGMNAADYIAKNIIDIF